MQQYFLQRVRAGVKHCQLPLGGPVGSQVMVLRWTLSDIYAGQMPPGPISSMWAVAGRLGRWRSSVKCKRIQRDRAPGSRGSMEEIVRG